MINFNKANKTLISILFLAWTIYASPAVAIQYTVTDLGSLGGMYTFATDVNNSGQVVGYGKTTANSDWHAFLYDNGSMQDLGSFVGVATSINNSKQLVGNDQSGGVSRAFLYSNGNMQDLGTLGGLYSNATSINDSGHVVGTSYLAGDINGRAFLYSNGSMQDLGTLGGTESFAYAINNNGQVVGTSYITDSTTIHAFLYSDGSMQDLGTLGGLTSEAFAINNNGQVVGYAYTDEVSTNSFFSGFKYRAFLYSNGSMQDLGTLGGSYSKAFDINSSGQVVGYSYIQADADIQAFLYNDGIMTNLNSLLDASIISEDWQLDSAVAINDNGSIVANAYNTRTGYVHAFLLSVTPVPEADTFAMLLSGLGVLGFAKRRKQKKS